MAIFKGLVKVLRDIFVGQKSSRRKQKINRVVTRTRRAKKYHRPSAKRKKKGSANVRARKSKVVKKRRMQRAPKLSRKSKIRKSKVSVVKSAQRSQDKGIKKVEGVYSGEITHYFPKIGVVVIKVSAGLKVGDRIRIVGSADFTQVISSMQIESIDVKQVRKGQMVGLKVSKIAKVRDKVYKI